MKLKPTLFAALVAGLAFGTAQAQTKWDMPTPYPDSNFHTKNVKQFADDVKAASGGKLEIVVHSDDLAVSVDLEPPAWPEEVIAPVLGVLTTLAVRKHGVPAVLRTLARAERAPGSIAAI